MSDAFEDSFEDLLDEPDPVEEPASKPRGKKIKPFGCLLNLLSGILVTGTLVVGLIFAIIFINPQTMINPLPPTTLPAVVHTNTPSPTPRPVLPPTWTPTNSPTPEPTETPIPTDTPAPTETPVPTADLESGTTFRMEDGFPSYEVNSNHPDSGCNWLGVAGQVFDRDGAAVPGILIEAGGSLAEIDVSGLTLSGMAPNYGEGGYEITLHDTPLASENAVWIQLLDQANLPLTDKIYFQTFDSCDSNLVMINFVQTGE